ADIARGDVSTTLGASIIFDGVSTYTVTGAHLYGEEGPYTITVTIHHEMAPDAVATSTASVSDPAVTRTGGFAFSAVEGALSATQTVATFTDPGGAEPNASDPTGTHYTADIAWGDGSSTIGAAISFDGVSTFTVSGAHLYGEEGTYTISVTIHHESAPDASTTSTASVSDPAVVAMAVPVFAV